MKVDIYRAKISPGPKEKIYIFVPEGYNIENLPDKVKEFTSGLDF